MEATLYLRISVQRSRTCSLNEAVILGYVDVVVIRTTSNAVMMPVDASPAYASGGITVAIAPEAAVIPQNRLKVQLRSVKLDKLTALIPISDELQEDAQGLSAYLTSKLLQIFRYKVNDYILNGATGLLSSAARISQAAEGGQMAGSIVWNNLANMYSRLLPGMVQGSVWCVHTSSQAH